MRIQYATVLTLPFLAACVSSPVTDIKGYQVADSCLQYTRILTKSPGLYSTKDEKGSTTGITMAFKPHTIREVVMPFNCEKEKSLAAAILEEPEAMISHMASNMVSYEKTPAPTRSPKEQQAAAIKNIDNVLKSIIVEQPDGWKFSFDTKKSLSPN